jgi:hypothetical protein
MAAWLPDPVVIGPPTRPRSRVGYSRGNEDSCRESRRRGSDNPRRRRASHKQPKAPLGPRSAPLSKADRQAVRVRRPAASGTARCRFHRGPKPSRQAARVRLTSRRRSPLRRWPGQWPGQEDSGGNGAAVRASGTPLATGHGAKRSRVAEVDQPSTNAILVRQERAWPSRGWRRGAARLGSSQTSRPQPVERHRGS